MRYRMDEERRCRASNLTFEMAARMITETLGNSATSSLRRDSVLSKSAADCRRWHRRSFQWELEQCAVCRRKRKANLATVAYASVTDKLWEDSKVPRFLFNNIISTLISTLSFATFTLFLKKFLKFQILQKIILINFFSKFLYINFYRFLNVIFNQI